MLSLGFGLDWSEVFVYVLKLWSFEAIIMPIDERNSYFCRQQSARIFDLLPRHTRHIGGRVPIYLCRYTRACILLFKFSQTVCTVNFFCVPNCCKVYTVHFFQNNMLPV